MADEQSKFLRGSTSKGGRTGQPGATHKVEHGCGDAQGRVLWKRREFLAASGALAMLGPLPAYAKHVAAAGKPAVVRLGRMAYTPATAYRPYVSRRSSVAAQETWVQLDLGSMAAVTAVRLYPAFAPGMEHMVGFGFPVRFRIELSDDDAFARRMCVADGTTEDWENPGDQILELRGSAALGRYVRLTAVKLAKDQDGSAYVLALSKLEVIAGDTAVAAVGVSGDTLLGNTEDLRQLIRGRRPMGEGIVTDQAANVSAAAQWKPALYRAQAPRRGVEVGDGPFHEALENNIGYLLRSFSLGEMLRPFRQRAGRPVQAGMREPIPFWETELLGSSAGRFLMGAGNTLRWREHAELRAWMNAIVDGIEECRQPNGYIMAYPEETIFVSERGGYTRAWVTHGLIEAGYAGNAKAFRLLRGYYDWFDRCPYLPRLLRGAVQGVQGMVANTRMYFTPEGKPEDIQVIQRYFQENYWLEGLAQRKKSVVWQYPYDRPHNYLITDFEAYLDLYRATGEKRYLEAMEGAWVLYRDNWEHVGGSIAITEFGEFPPKSYRLKAQQPFCETGETCGSVFWTRFNQRFHLLYPDEEKYVTEIEKSIYNVGLANQVGSSGIIYHARLVGQKGELHVPLCTNSCCEGQGTRLLGSLPEYIYSLAKDGVYVNLYQASTLTWSQDGQEMKLVQETAFPFDAQVTLRVSCMRPQQATIRVRVPSWAGKPMRVLFCGGLMATGLPGTYVTLDRVWQPEDTIRFTLPMDFRLTRYTGTDQIPGYARYALEYGPVLMALVGSDSGVLEAQATEASGILQRLRPEPYKPLHFTVEGQLGCSYMPYWKVLNEPFTCFPAIAVRSETV